MAGPTLNPIESAEQQSSRMLALVAHELRSPTAVVNGYLRLLLKKRASELAEEDRKLLEDAARGCTRLMHVLRELDELADLEAADVLRSPVPVPIFELCEEVIRASALDGAAVSFQCSDADRLARVRGDADRLREAIGALVAVCLREHRHDGAEVYGAVRRDDGSARALLVFGGPGLAARRTDLSAADGEFDRWRGGTGLALPIASRIVEIHGGRLWSLPGPTPACALALPVVP